MKTSSINFVSKDKAQKLDKLKEFEKRLPGVLPKEYVKYILKYGTGKGLKEHLCFDVMEYGDLESDIVSDERIFNALSSVAELNIHFEALSISAYQPKCLPKDMIMVGSDLSDNPVLLCIEGAYYGKVFFWNPVLCLDIDDEEDSYENIGLVANSFQEFIQCLHSCSE